MKLSSSNNLSNFVICLIYLRIYVFFSIKSSTVGIFGEIGHILAVHLLACDSLPILVFTSSLLHLFEDFLRYPFLFSSVGLYVSNGSFDCGSIYISSFSFVGCRFHVARFGMHPLLWCFPLVPTPSPFFRFRFRIFQSLCPSCGNLHAQMNT